jgi:hypothetical protein
MADETKSTTNIIEIRNWVERLKGKPEMLGGITGEGVVTLRFAFPGNDDDKYLSDKKERKELSWEEFEEKFNTMNLVFEYEDREKIGDPSSSYRFYVRENKDLKEDTLL